AGGEGAEAADACEAEPDRLQGCPAGAVCLRDRVDDRGQAGGGEESAAQVEAAPTRLLGVGGDDLLGGDGEDGGDGEVDEEDQSPVGDLGEQTTDENADRCA